MGINLIASQLICQGFNTLYYISIQDVGPKHFECYMNWSPCSSYLKTKGGSIVILILEDCIILFFDNPGRLYYMHGPFLFGI
jgi:hypothetical protein